MVSENPLALPLSPFLLLDLERKLFLFLLTLLIIPLIVLNKLLGLSLQRFLECAK